jgi:hypothetical protein
VFLRSTVEWDSVQADDQSPIPDSTKQHFIGLCIRVLPKILLIKGFVTMQEHAGPSVDDQHQGARRPKEEGQTELLLLRVLFIGGLNKSCFHPGCKTSWSPTFWVRKKGVYMSEDKSDFILVGIYPIYCKLMSKSQAHLCSPGPVVKFHTLKYLFMYSLPGNYAGKNELGLFWSNHGGYESKWLQSHQA